MKVVTYHYVRHKQESFPYFRYLNFDNFRRQLDYFQSTGYMLSMKEFIDIINGDIPLKDGYVLSFDDGIRDHYDIVFPELVKRELWGIFFISSLPLTHSKMLDVHKIHCLLGRYGGKEMLSSLRSDFHFDTIPTENKKNNFSETYLNQNNDKDTYIFKRTLNYILEDDVRRNVINALMLKYFNENDLVNSYYMTEGQILEMHSAGMLIGAHSVNHSVMSKLTHDKQNEEINDSFLVIENILKNKSLRLFCYPYGGHESYTYQTESLLKKNDCKASFTTESRKVTKKDLIDSPYAIPRIDCNKFPYGACS